MVYEMNDPTHTKILSDKKDLEKHKGMIKESKTISRIRMYAFQVKNLPPADENGNADP